MISPAHAAPVRLPALLLALLLALAWTAPADAHLTPNSEIRLDFGRAMVAMEVIVPMGELGYALQRPIPLRASVKRDATLRRYFLSHMAVSTADGRPWTVILRDIAVVNDGAEPDLRAHFELRPPPGAGVRRFDLAYSAVIDRVPNHFVLVAARNDFDAGRLSDRPRVIGGLQGGVRTLHLDRGTGSAWRGFASAIRLGMRHITEGHDHLLFLMALLLPAPLLAQGRRWGGYGGPVFTVRRLAGVVSAFTAGHSATLIGGAFLGWRLPAQPVEVAIAVSILVSSVHAWRPLFAGREPWVAAGFGLVHGLAFASAIGRFGLEPLQKAQSILGFNLGIELVQLVAVAAVVPGLAMLARTPSYTPFRNGAAIFCGIAAAAWIAERTLGAANPIARVIDTGLVYAPWLAVALSLGAVAATLAERRRRAADMKTAAPSPGPPLQLEPKSEA